MYMIGDGNGLAPPDTPNRYIPSGG